MQRAKVYQLPKFHFVMLTIIYHSNKKYSCLLYTSDAADERSSVDLGGRRIIKKKKETQKENTKKKTHTRKSTEPQYKHKNENKRQT